MRPNEESEDLTNVWSKRFAKLKHRELLFAQRNEWKSRRERCHVFIPNWHTSKESDFTKEKTPVNTNFHFRANILLLSKLYLFLILRVYHSFYFSITTCFSFLFV